MGAGPRLISLARIFHELAFRDRADGCSTGQPQGLGPEAYLNSTSQGKLVLPVPPVPSAVSGSAVSGSQAKEDPRTPGGTTISTVVVGDS